MSAREREVPEGKIVNCGDRIFRWSNGNFHEMTGWDPVWKGFTGKDMDDAVQFLTAKGLSPTQIKTAIDGVIKRSLSMVEMLWVRFAFEFDTTTPDGRAAFEAAIFEKVGLIQHPIVKKHYQQWFREQIAKAFGTSQTVVQNMSRRTNVLPFRTSKRQLLDSLNRLESTAADVRAMRQEGCLDDIAPPPGGEGR